MEEWMWIIWLTIFVVSLIIEAIGTDLVSIWFAFGALVSLIISFTACPWWVELIVFITVSASTLLVLRPLAHKWMRRGITKTNVDEIINSKGVMTAKYDLLHHGEVKINGVIWTAIGQNEKDVLNVGDVESVVGISGNKLIVKEFTKEGEN